MTQRKLPQSPEDQHRRFVEIAQQLGADEDKERFEDKLRQIASVKPKPKKAKPDK